MKKKKRKVTRSIRTKEKEEIMHECFFPQSVWSSKSPQKSLSKKRKKELKAEKGVRLIVDRWGYAHLSGLRNDFAKYEKDIFNGRIPCPFTVEFKDKDGNIVSRSPIPLNSNGNPKFDLFGVKS